VALPGACIGTILLSLESNRVRFSPEERQLPGIVCDGRSLEIPSEVVNIASGAIDVQVDAAVNAIRFTDAMTAAPVVGTAFLTKRVILEHRDPVELVAMHRDELEGGWMEFPFGFAGGRGDWPDSVQGIVSIAGYRPFTLPPEADPFDMFLSPDLSFALTPVSHPSWLKVLDLGAPIDAGILALRSITTGDLLFVGGASSVLTYGPFDSGGSEVQVSALASGMIGRAATSGASGEEYLLDIGADLGSIRVENPDGELPPLFCMNTDRGATTTQTFNNGYVCVFDRIPAGHYVVGPKEWVLQVCTSRDSPKRRRIEVCPGEVSIVQSEPEWVMHEDLEGRVVLEPGACLPSLLVAYSTPVGLPAVRESTQRVWLKPDGSYLIRSGAGPVPTALLAVERTGGLLRVRGVLEPGGQAFLDEVVVELTLPPGTTESEILDVSYTHGKDWTDLPVRESLRQADFRVEVAAHPIHFCVHASVDRISIRRLRDGMNRTIDLSGERIQSFDLQELFL